jgi:gliding motility-associated-like protein
MLTKCFCFLILAFLLIPDCFSQLRVTIPASSSLNVTFGKGSNNTGAPLQVGSTDFIYTNNVCPQPGQYAVTLADNCFKIIQHDAGHIFYTVHPLENDSGYMMIANYNASTISKTVFEDTVKNLCGNNQYLFWAGIRNLSNSTCFYPNFSFVVETVSDQTIQSFQTGDIGGATDKAAPYFGYLAPDPRTSFPAYYGGIFTLPAGINDVVVKIITNPTNAYSSCTSTFAIDNIILMPVGAEINISDPSSPGGWVTGTCFKGGKPVTLNSDIGSGYYNFGGSGFVVASFNSPAYQWQRSVDDGYTWTDISGETNASLSRQFSIPDTFYIRLRVSENYNINNPNCSVVSNVMQVQVDGLPKDFDITSNTPVCTDSDIVLNVTGGATYIVTGPNGFYDNTAFPHVYHPVLADSGWYYVQITSFGGCIANDSTFVQVIGPNLQMSVDDNLLCYGQTTQLHSSGGNVYLWSPSTGLSNANIPNPIAKPLSTTKYQLKITDDSKCSAYGSITIQLLDSILKAQMVAPTFICPNDLATFKDTSIGKLQSWHWNFGNGQTSNAQNPPPQHYAFAENNIQYPVQLIVVDSAGCVDTIVSVVKVINNCYIAVPSAFTPNHDGLNDYLYPLNAYKATNLTFKVYNRFGHIVFETNDWTKKWDGTINGMPQPAGTYVWILNYTDASNQKVVLQGTTVLIR